MASDGSVSLAFPGFVAVNQPLRRPDGIKLTDLPAEMLLEIVRHLRHSKRTLFVLSLSCKTLNEIATPVLYETVILRLQPAQGFQQKVLLSLTSENHPGLKYIRNFGVAGELKAHVVQGTVARNWFAQGLPRGGNREFAQALTNMVIFAVNSVMRHMPPNILESFVWHCDLEAPEDRILSELRRVQNGAIDIYWASTDIGISTIIRHPDSELRSLHLEDISPRMFTQDYAVGLLNFPKTLEKLTFNIGTDRSLANPIGEFLRAELASLENADLNNPFEAYEDLKFPHLRYVHIGDFDDILLGHYPFFIKVINPEVLTTLKLHRGNYVSGILNQLSKMRLKLKVLHLLRYGLSTDVSHLLSTFRGLEELFVDCIRSKGLPTLDKGVYNHGRTLKRLYVREVYAEDGASCGLEAMMHDLISLPVACPYLVEFGVAMPLQITNLKDFQFMTRLKLIWIINSLPEMWYERPPNPTTFKNQLDGFLNDRGGAETPYIAMGPYYKVGFPFIYQIWGLSPRAKKKKMVEMWNRISHRDMFEANPELTLLQAASPWFPWNEECEFIDPVPHHTRTSWY